MNNNNILNQGFDHFKNILSKEETLELENIIDELNDNDDVQRIFADYKRKNNR